MKAPKKGDPAQTFKLRNSSGKDVQFDGWLLAEVSNYRTGVDRWKERAVYQTKGGKIVCHKLGRSCVKGETDRGEIRVIDPMEKSAPWSTAVVTPDSRVSDFFGYDSLAKDLLNLLEIVDVQQID